MTYSVYLWPLQSLIGMFVYKGLINAFFDLLRSEVYLEPSQTSNQIERLRRQLIEQDAPS